MLAKVDWALNFIGKYKWEMSNADLNATKELGLTDIKKYWRYTSQVKIEVDWLHDWISVLATFMRYLLRVYNNTKVTNNLKVKQDIDQK